MTEAHQAAPLLRTPLHKLHAERGARLMAFAGYEMPVQYPHRHDRDMAPSDSRSVNRYGHGHSVCKFPINVTVPLSRRASSLFQLPARR